MRLFSGLTCLYGISWIMIYVVMYSNEMQLWKMSAKMRWRMDEKCIATRDTSGSFFLSFSRLCMFLCGEWIVAEEVYCWFAAFQIGCEVVPAKCKRCKWFNLTLSYADLKICKRFFCSLSYFFFKYNSQLEGFCRNMIVVRERLEALQCNYVQGLEGKYEQIIKTWNMNVCGDWESIYFLWIF